MGKKARAEPPRLIAEQKEAARRLGITDRQLRNWRDDPSFPDCSAGYDLGAIEKWRDEHQRAGSEARESAEELYTALQQEKLERERLKNREIRLKLDQQEGELLPRETQERAIAAIATKSGDCHDQLPDIIRGVCCKKCQDRVWERIKKELDQWRADLCAALSNLPSQHSP